MTGLVLGGNKSLLFNAEYLINIAGPVRLVLFADAGQVRNTGENFGWKEADHRRSARRARCCRGRSIHSWCRSPVREPVRSRDRGRRRSRRVQDVDWRGDPVLHAGAERAVPV